MRPLVIATIVFISTLGVHASALPADESTAPAPAAAQSAQPAAASDAAVHPAGGCMPNGGCCGQGACSKAAEGAEKAADSAAGGCPCMKNKHKPES